MRNQFFVSKKTTEFLDFCSRSQLILLFSLFRFFGRAREERSSFKCSKNENVTISLDRVQIHLPKTTKRDPPETCFLRKKGRCSKRLQNGIVKISWGFPSKSPHGFTKNGLERVPENAPARARSAGRPEGPHIENVTISLYRVTFHLPKKLKWSLPGGSREVDFEICFYKKGKETIATQQKPAFHEKLCFPMFFNYFLNTDVDNRNQTLGHTPLSETPQGINIV